MAYKASAFFKGNARKPVPSGFHAGATATVTHSHAFSEALTTSDVLELLLLPAGARIASFSFALEGVTGSNSDIGLMSGTPGDPNGARTVGDELADGVTQAATDAHTSLVDLAAIPVSDVDRSIGFIAAANITADAAKKLHVRMTLQF